MFQCILQTSNYLGAEHTTGGIVDHIALGLDRKNALEHVICMGGRGSRVSSQKLRKPVCGMGLLYKAMNALGKVGGLRRLNNYNTKMDLFDKLSLRHIKPCSVFHSWDRTERCFRKAKNLGAKTILEVEMDIWPGEILKYVDYVFVPSKFLYSKAIEIGVPIKNLFYLPFGVDAEFFHPLNPEFPRDKEKRFLFCGALNDRKGIGELMKAWELAKIPNAKLVLCGRSTPFFRHYLEQIDSNSIEVLGFLSRMQLLAEYQRAYAFVFPSKKEGSAKVIYEALACGLPVITTEESGSVISNDKEGFIIHKNNIKILSQKIITIAENSDLRKEMSKAARTAALQNTWEHYKMRTMNFYEQILTSDVDCSKNGNSPNH